MVEYMQTLSTCQLKKRVVRQYLSWHFYTESKTISSNSFFLSLTHTNTLIHTYSSLLALSDTHRHICGPLACLFHSCFVTCQCWHQSGRPSHACCTITKSFWRTPHPVVQPQSVHCSVMWTNGGPLLSMKICDLSESEWHFLSIVVVWCSAWLTTWLMDHLALVKDTQKYIIQ